MQYGPMSTPRYIHGHHESVLRSHTWRTAENSAGYLLASLAPGQRLLDVGCGPGTITADLAGRVAPGPVLGIDRSDEVVATASELAGPGAPNLTFAVGDVYHLDQDDGTFDVAHAHQVLQHLADPVAALVELRRVLRAGGTLAVRDGDYGAFTWWPADPLLTRWLDLYHQVARHDDGEPDAGRFLPHWVARAGFEDLTVTGSVWVYATPGEREWWGSLWADRVRYSAFGQHALDYGLSTADELEAVADAFTRWAATPDAVFVVPAVEVLARA